MKNRLQRRHSTLFFETRKFNRLPLKSKMEETKNTSVFLTQAAIIVLLLTVLSYSFAALFKGGYHQYFHLNSLAFLKCDTNDLIHFFLELFLYIAGALFWYLVILFSWIIPFKFTIPSKALFEQIHSTVIILVTIYISLSLIFDLQNHWMTQLLFFGILIVFAFYSRLPKKIQNILKHIGTPLHSYKFLTLITLFIFFGFSSHQLGIKTAKEQTSYLMFTKDNIDYVVISNNDKNLISVPINTDSTIKPHFKITSQTENILFKTVVFPNGIQVEKPQELK
ncbi:hypothetical protein [Bacillus thuringiensis]|uniref:hypothetical protein n=1 Tax=Bacillus thuringiensis TaxID=1428 RepID=UPI000E2E7699|nr:hypothetical protein [Bacillus thuringiensis]RFB53687.1 hypothetical protein DZB90_24815 [Bacillus thuringiensis]